MTEVQLAVVIGFAVSLGLQLLKRLWPGLDVTEALVKQITAVALAAVGVLVAAHWQVSADVAGQVGLRYRRRGSHDGLRGGARGATVVGISSIRCG